MFEKEAEEYIKKNNLEWELECHRTSPIGEVNQAFQKGAEYGYNKGFEFGVKSNEKVNQIVANEWHDLRKNPQDLSKHANRVFVYTDEGVGLGVYGLDNGKWYTYDTGFNVIAWKEIVLPKES